MRNHLAVYVKERELQEFINKLDSKGWAVIDMEPANRINWYSIITGAIGIIIASLNFWNIISCNVAINVGIILGIILLSTLSLSRVTEYMVVCEYIGNEEYIDVTPFDDTDDEFIKNENYKPDKH